MIIPELEEAAKSYRRTGVCAYTTEQDDTLLRYCGNIPKDLLMKYFPGKTYGALEGRKRRLIKLQKKKKGATVDKPTDGLYASTPPTKKKPGLNSITSRGNLNRKGKGKHGDLKIPISAVTDKKGYMAAYLLCKRHGWLPYPEALALENKSVENIQKSTEKVMAPSEKKAGALSKSGLTVRKQPALPLHQHPKAITEPQEDRVSDESQEWTEAEDAAIAGCPNEDAMLMRYMEKFPESNRRALDVIEHWKALHVDTDVAEAGV